MARTVASDSAHAAALSAICSAGMVISIPLRRAGSGPRATCNQTTHATTVLVGLADGLTPASLLVKLLTMTTLPLGEVKTHLSELVGRVHDHHERVTVTVHGRPSAVLVAVEDLERLEETLAIMRDADTMRRLAESDAELARGEDITAAELAEAIRNRSAHE